jgi:hypothetical protein
MTTPQPTPFQADFDAKTFEDQVICLRRWASDPATQGRYDQCMKWLFSRDQATWRMAHELAANCFRV